MRKEIAFFVFVISISLVFSMEDSIIVKTNPGDHVKLYAWKAGGGPLFVMKEGIAEEGIFTTTFFSVKETEVRYQIIILRNGEKVRDEAFDNYTTSEPLLINCLPTTCTISIYNESESLNENYKVIEVNSSSLLSEEEKLNGSNESESFRNFYFKEYLISNIWIVGLFFLAIIFIVAIIIIVIFLMKRKRFYDKEEKELEELQRKIKEKSEEIKKIKEEKSRKQKIKGARKKLAEEEKEIREIKEKQINEAKSKLAEKELELKRLKGDEAKISFESNNKNQKESPKSNVKRESQRLVEPNKEPKKEVLNEKKDITEKKASLYENSLNNKGNKEVSSKSE
jgi:ABC-type multidrug transport system fused ATPase/permease subunit